MRVNSLAKYLPLYGWRPIVLTVKEKYYDSSEGFLDPSLLEGLDDRLEVHRTDCFQPWLRWRSVETLRSGAIGHRRSKFRKFLKQIHQVLFIPDDKLFWAFNALSEIRRILKSSPIDVILATTPYHSVGLIGAFASFLWQIPFVLDIRDDWVGNPLWWSGQYWHRRVLEPFLERWMFYQASAVITVTNESRSFVMSKYPRKNQDQIHYIPNGFDPQDFEADDNGNCPTKFDRPGIVYIGSLPRRRDPSTLFLAMARIKQTQPKLLPDLHFVGPMDSQLLSAAQSLGLTEHVHCHGAVDHKSGIQFLRAASACLLLSPPDDGCKTVIPGKLYEYLAAKKPILAITPRDSATAHLLAGYDLGLIVEPESVDQIQDALLAVAELSDLDLGTWNGLQAFDRRALIAKFAYILDNLEN